MVTGNGKGFMICGEFIHRRKMGELKILNSLAGTHIDESLRSVFFPLHTLNIWHEFSALITDAERRQRQIFILHSCFTVKILFGLFIQFHCYSFYGW